MKTRNPFIGEGIRAAFSHPPMLRTYSLFLLAMTCLTAFMWPWSPLVSYMSPREPPLIFTVAALGFFFCLIFINARFGAGDYEPVHSTKVRDFVNLTPVPVSTVVAGKLVVGVLHILFLLVLGLPFLLFTREAGGKSMGELAGVVLVAGTASLAFRCYAFALFVMLGDRKGFRQAVLIVSATPMLLVIPFFPAASPVAAIYFLAAANPPRHAAPVILGVPMPFFLISIIISLCAACVFYGLSVAWLRLVRRNHAAAAASGRKPARDSDTGDGKNEPV
jgi:hypothetical protein